MTIQYHVHSLQWLFTKPSFLMVPPLSTLLNILAAEKYSLCFLRQGVQKHVHFSFWNLFSSCNRWNTYETFKNRFSSFFKSVIQMPPNLKDNLREPTLASQQSKWSSPNKSTNSQDSFGHGGAVSFLPDASAPDSLP